MSTPNWFVSHTHLDHIAALPVYVARRRMMKMEPPTIYMPSEAVEGVEQLLRAFQKLDRGRMPAKLVGVRAGDEIELSRELVVTAVPDPAHHPLARLPRLGAASKLKPEYQHLIGDDLAIRDLRQSGVEVSAEIRIPKVAYLGDTAPPGLDVLPEIYRAEILILEMTFVAPQERPEKIHKFGHTHLDDIIARADRFENDCDHRLALQHPAPPRPDPTRHPTTLARPLGLDPAHEIATGPPSL